METLLTIPRVELWKVKDGQRELLATNEWRIVDEHSRLISKVTMRSQTPLEGSGQIGNCAWRLHPSLPCLKASELTYVFAIDIDNAVYYCLKLPQDISDDDIAVLEATLDEFTSYRVDAASPPSKTDKFINGLGQATSMAIAGMTGAANYVGDKLLQGAERYKRQKPACTEPKAISEQTKERVKKVRQLAKVASGMANAAVDAVTVFTSKAADTILGTVNHDDPDKPASKAKRVTAAVIVSAAEIYDGMVDAFYIVSKKTADATKEVVTHKSITMGVISNLEVECRYGEEAGQVSEDSLLAIGHSANAVVQSSRVGTKAVLKSTAKKTALGLVSSNAPAPALRES